MRRFAVRQRPLQPTKRIRVYHLTADGSFISENGDRIAANLYDLDEYSQERASALGKARISIPKPPIRTIPNYDSEVSHSFKRSNGFIKYIPLTLEEEENKVEYNLDYSDEMWIRGHKVYGDNAPEAKRITLELFERMLDSADKYCGEHKAEPTDILETLFIQKLQFSRVDSHEVCKCVLDYWKKKRKELGKPLLRRYWPLTSISDSSPSLVFRPRCRDDHYRLRKKNKSNEEVMERLIELRGNLEHSRSLCQLTHKREQLKLKKLMYIYETVVEVHYLLTTHSGPRALTCNLTDMFVYEGRTSSILSASASANSYASFNPLVSRSFGTDSRFSMGMNTISEEMDEITALTTTTAVNHISSDEKHYMQLLALSQLGGFFNGNEVIRCETPSLVINQSGSTDLSSANWLMPVPGRSSYEHFYTDTVGSESSMVDSKSASVGRWHLQTRVRLRGRVARGGRIVIDRLVEAAPLFGDNAKEIYMSPLPIGAVRRRPATSSQQMRLDGTTPSRMELVNLDSVTTVKRSYQEMTQDQTSIPYCNFDSALTFNIGNEMAVHVEPSKRLILKRNGINDQIQFFM